MKKERQTSRQGPIQLSANKKSHSINLKTKQEPLFAPYKIDWKNPCNDNIFLSANQSVPLKQPFKSIENNNINSQFGNRGSSNTSSKLFYQNMKNELQNIKQDVEKRMILKDRKTSIASVDQMTNTHDYPLSEHQNNNGCIKTVSIKNKCQQRLNKVDSVYENVDKFIASKISQNGLGSSKLTGGQSKCEHPTMNNFIEDQVKNASNAQIKYRSQKDSSYIRAKSKSIAECFTKNFALDLLNAREQKRQAKVNIASSLKFIQCEENQNQQQPLTERSQRDESVKQKVEVQIKLPSFDKPKTDQIQEEKNKLIQKLQKELNDLEKELSLRDELMSRKEQCKFQLTEEVQNIKKQLQQETLENEKKQRQYEEEISHLRHFAQQNENRAKFYQEQLQKAINVIRQKEQQASTMIENLNMQTNTIQQLSTACEKLRTHNKEMKQSVEQSRSIKEKMKLKENQLYIYQEELKEAKSKIRELKESLSNSVTARTEKNFNKSIQDQQRALEESSILNWELKECRKLNQNIKSQNQRLNKQIHSISSINSQNQSKITQLIKENSELKAKILEFEKDSQKAIQDLVSSVTSQGLGSQISKKLSFLSEENYQLKNKINRLEANLEELTLKNGSLTEELKIHEEKASSFKDYTRRLKVEDWDNLTDERDNLKSQLQVVKNRLDETKEFYELQTMRKQNQIYELKHQIEQMIELEAQNEQQFHPNVRSVKHIKNLNILLSEFKEMIEYNLELKEDLLTIKR